MSHLNATGVDDSSSSMKAAGRHHETAHHHGEFVDETANFEVEQSTLPPGYFTSSFFVGTMFACGLGLFAGVAGFGYAAPNLALINEDIGPNPNYIWISLVYSLVTAVTLTIIGRVSDIFGRRWIFIGGALFALIGCIVCATAQTVPTFIGGMTLISIGAATQLSYYYVMGELVPMKYRFLGNAFCYLFTIPGSGFAPLVAQGFISYQPKVGWRGPYYLLIVVNAITLALWFFFYHPPTFSMKHPGAKVKAYIKHFDYVGTVLYTGGLLIFLLGLNWGGSVYPWASAAVIATLVIGFVSLVAFILWEAFANLKEPLLPTDLFLNRPWVLSTVISGLGASIYYAFAIVWPQMVAVLYGDGGPISSAGLACLSSVSIVFGEVVGGVAASYFGRAKWQTVISITLAGIFYAAMAASTPNTKVLASVFIFIGSFFAGWTESIAISAVTLTATNQNELGTASGAAGSIRFLISAISSTVYTLVLKNRLAQTVPAEVPPALTGAGLPSSSVSAFIAALTAGDFSAVPGVNSDIIAAGVAAYKTANADAFRTVFLVTIAFTGTAIICALLLPNLDELMNTKVATTLQREQEVDREKTVQ